MGKSLKAVSDSKEIDAFLNQAREVATTSANTARLMFAMDATASRSPTWDHASAYMSPKDAKKMDLFIQYGIAAGVQAFQDSGLEVTEQNASRIGAYSRPPKFNVGSPLAPMDLNSFSSR